MADNLLDNSAGDPAGNHGIHHFRAPVRCLLDLGETVIVRPRLNGLELDQPLTVAAHILGIAGCLDPGAALEARGWAIDLTDRTRPHRGRDASGQPPDRPPVPRRCHRRRAAR